MDADTRSMGSREREKKQVRSSCGPGAAVAQSLGSRLTSLITSPAGQV